MKASPSDQRSIVDIARFDQQTNSLRHKATNLPEIAELASTTIKSNNARDLRIAAETELSDVKRELLRAEADVEQIVSRITRDEARLNGGSATPKELEQLQHEVGTLGARRAELEEVELEIMMRADAINERITSLKAEEAEQSSSMNTESKSRKFEVVTLSLFSPCFNILKTASVSFSSISAYRFCSSSKFNKAAAAAWLGGKTLLFKDKCEKISV